MSGREFRFALPKQQRLPTLGLDLGGTWNGRELAVNGRVNGIKGDTLELSGTAPLVLTPTMASPCRRRDAWRCGSRAPARSPTSPICCRSAKTALPAFRAGRRGQWHAGGARRERAADDRRWPLREFCDRCGADADEARPSRGPRPPDVRNFPLATRRVAASPRKARSSGRRRPHRRYFRDAEGFSHHRARRSGSRRRAAPSR